MIEPAHGESESRLGSSVQPQPHGALGPKPPPEPAAEAAPPAKPPARDPFDRFGELSTSEKILFAASAAILLAFAVRQGWTLLFAFDARGGWFFTFALLGAALTQTSILLKLFDVRIVSAGVQARLTLLVAMLPAVGLLIELLSLFWLSLMMAAAGAMAYAALRAPKGTDEPAPKP